jgi:hypothetical protein
MESTRDIQRHKPWNKGKPVGQKAPFKLKEIWAIPPFSFGAPRLRLERRPRPF